MAKSRRSSGRRSRRSKRGLPPALKAWNKKLMELHRSYGGNKSLKDCMKELKRKSNRRSGKRSGRR